MSGPKRNPDRLNTIGVVAVGICGAVLVYVTIVALEAFYVNDTSGLQTMADYGGQDTGPKWLRTEQVNRRAGYGSDPPAAAPRLRLRAAPLAARHHRKAMASKSITALAGAAGVLVLAIAGPKVVLAHPPAPDSATAPSSGSAARPAPDDEILAPPPTYQAGSV